MGIGRTLGQVLPFGYAVANLDDYMLSMRDEVGLFLANILIGENELLFPSHHANYQSASPQTAENNQKQVEVARPQGQRVSARRLRTGNDPYSQEAKFGHSQGG